MTPLLALSQALSPQGSDPLRPGTPVLEGARIAAGTDSLALVVVQDGEARMAGFMTLQTTREGANLVRAERLFGADGSTLHADSFAVDAATLAPRYQVSEGRTRTFDAGAGAFYANSVDLVLGALPLAEGYEAQLVLTADEGEAEAETVAPLRVTGQETVRALDGGACAAWRVAFEKDGAGSVYWISTQTGRLVQFVSPGDGLAFVRLRGCPTPS